MYIVPLLYSGRREEILATVPDELASCQVMTLLLEMLPEIHITSKVGMLVME
jgi:hypothetical protein